MTRSDSKRRIEAARASFDAELHTAEFRRVHADDAQLELLLDCLAPAPGGNYLDLATGNGYVAFAIAGRAPGARVTGLDVAENAIETNAALARERSLAETTFAVTDGVALDLPTASFDGVVCRFALHHMPELATTLAEIRRVLTDDGRFVFADAVMAEADDRDFLNRFQALKPDGHVRMYTKDGLIALFADAGFRPFRLATTSIAYSRPLDPDYQALIDETPPAILGAYGISIQGDEVAVRVDILNSAFVKS